MYFGQAVQFASDLVAYVMNRDEGTFANLYSLMCAALPVWMECHHECKYFFRYTIFFGSNVRFFF